MALLQKIIKKINKINIGLKKIGRSSADIAE